MLIVKEVHEPIHNERDTTTRIFCLCGASSDVLTITSLLYVSVVFSTMVYFVFGIVSVSSVTVIEAVQSKILGLFCVLFGVVGSNILFYVCFLQIPKIY